MRIFKNWFVTFNQLICYPETPNDEEGEPKNQETYIEGILRNLQIWTQRQSRLQLLFLFRSVDKIDSIDKTVVADVARLTTGIIQSTPHGKHRMFRIPGTTRDVPNVWLLSNLIGNLPEALHLKAVFEKFACFNVTELLRVSDK